jgi:DNA repair exonuclease SbcCD ATPase subunit
VIIFRTLTFKNFLSVGNTPVSIDLDKHSTTLIHGKNGSGKSTILDALTYGLFNKPFRKVNLPQLINTQNKKGLVVEVEFTIGPSTFKVVRGMKPKLLEIYKDGEQLDNKAADKDMQGFLEQQILKLTYKSFTQIVILGSSNFIPFMQLPSAGRRECVEDFLDIKVFSTMSVIAKERLRSLKESARELAGDASNLEFKIDVQEQRVKELEQQSTANITELEAVIAEAEAEIEELEAQIKVRGVEESVLLRETQRLVEKNPQKKSSELNKVIIKLGNKVLLWVTLSHPAGYCATTKEQVNKCVELISLREETEVVILLKEATLAASPLK